LLGIGTAIVYPTFLAAVSHNTHPDQRPKSIGIFRLWRDLGYAIGAILTGLIADQFGLTAPILAIGLLTILSSLIIKFRMKCATEKSVTCDKSKHEKNSAYVPVSASPVFVRTALQVG